MTKSKKPKIGLALGSGGAKGLAHIGVIKVLATNNIPINFIAGSSIGALVGAYYAAYENLDKLEKVALSSNWRTGLFLFDPTWRGGLIKGKKIEKLIKTWLNEVSFDNLKIPLTVVTTDLITGKEVDILSGDMIKAVRASLSVPAIFRPVKYNGRLLADGGLSNPLPDNVVRRMGADFVIAVNLDNEYFDNGLNENNLSLPKISIRALNVMRYHLARNCLKTADVVIEPKIGEIGLVGWNKFFSSQKTKQTIKVGEDATFRVLAKIKNYLN
jgi:NTE family protein